MQPGSAADQLCVIVNIDRLLVSREEQRTGAAHEPHGSPSAIVISREVAPIRASSGSWLAIAAAGRDTVSLRGRLARHVAAGIESLAN